MPKLFMEIEERDWFAYKDYLREKSKANMVNLTNATFFTVLSKMGCHIVKEHYSVNAEDSSLVVDAEFHRTDDNTTIQIHQEFPVYKEMPSRMQITDAAELQEIADNNNKSFERDLRWQ